MKTNSLLPLLAASLLAPGALLAQNTATTTPVGYVSLNVPANSDTTVGQPLHRSSEFSSSGVVSGNTVTISGTLTANRFVYSPPAQRNAYFLLVKSDGANNGRYFEVVSNTSNQFILETNIETAGITGTITFDIIPYHTLNSLFPGGAGVGISEDILEPAGLVQFRSNATGVNRPVVANFFYYQGTEESGTGWYNNDDLSTGLQDDATIDPHTAIRIRNLQNVAKTALISGTVPAFSATSPVVTASVRNDNYISVQYPVDVTLAQSGLAGSGVRAASDILEPVDLLMVFDDTATGRNKPLIKVYFYYEGEEEAGTGWYDNNNLSLGVQDNVPVLKAGRTYVIRKAAGTPGTTVVKSQLPYNLSN
jgi:uncharacterized protein (TIGR02597 family)